MDVAELEAALESAFGGTAAERRVVARQARDLADSGKHDADRGRSLTVEEVIENLEDAPEGTELPSRWNWWLGSLEVAYGGYREFQVERVPRE
jgi:predicted transcriptional regulator